LHAYGNRCSWCGSQENLELDHVAGGGNLHRQAIGTKLEYWLVKEHARTGYWPTVVQLLCTTPAHTGCHDAKSARRPTLMPARKGTTSIQVSIPDELVERLTALASQPGATKSTVMEAALRQLLEGSASQTLLEGLHQRLDSLTALITLCDQSQKALTLQVKDLGDRVTKQEGRYAEFTRAMASLYDAEKAARNGHRHGRWSQLFGGSRS